MALSCVIHTPLQFITLDIGWMPDILPIEDTLSQSKKELILRGNQEESFPPKMKVSTEQAEALILKSRVKSS